MNKKKISIAFVLVGILVFLGVGCTNKSLTNVQKQPVGDSTVLCDSAKEIKAPNDLAKELKSIFSEAGIEVKLTDNIQQDSSTGDTLVYVWKNKPDMEKLKSIFEKHGYKVEISGETLTAKKGDVILTIGLTEGLECQVINVRIINEQIKSSKKITDGECIEIMVDFRYSSYLLTVKNDPPHSLLMSKKAYDEMDMLAIKYGTTRDEIEKDCKARINEPGFMDKVEKREQELGYK